MEQSIPIINGALHSVVQLVGALAVGTLVDYAVNLVFPISAMSTRISTSKEALLETFEATAQIIVSSTVLGMLYNYLTQLNPRDADPTAGVLFGVILFGVAQPGLQTRLKRLVDYGRELVVKPAIAPAGKSSNDPNFNNPYRQNSVPATAQDQSYQLKMNMMRQNGFMNPSVGDQLFTEERASY